ncbi:MAG: hypothetical protein AAB250_05715, partial [Bdellovibrionota bacterium]
MLALCVLVTPDANAGWLTGPDSVPSVVTEEELREAVETGLMKVPELQFIRTEAEKLGVKVYLFGGTAAGFAHYAKW